MFSSFLFLIYFYYNGKNQLFSSLVFSVPCFQSSCFSLRLCFGRKLSICAFQLGFCFFLLFSVPLYALCCSLLSPYVADPPWFFFAFLLLPPVLGFSGFPFYAGFSFLFPSVLPTGSWPSLSFSVCLVFHFLGLFLCFSFL